VIVNYRRFRFSHPNAPHVSAPIESSAKFLVKHESGRNEIVPLELGKRHV
jgi:hypothetical protein